MKAGGFVEYFAGKWRVNGRLAVTRSFGDDTLKPPITAEPEVVQYPIEPEDEFLMLSCDGLYDVLDYEAIAVILDENIQKGAKVGALASALVNEGVAKGSTDDITVMLVDLSRKYL